VNGKNDEVVGPRKGEGGISRPLPSLNSLPRHCREGGPKGKGEGKFSRRGGSQNWNRFNGMLAKRSVSARGGNTEKGLSSKILIFILGGKRKEEAKGILSKSPKSRTE